MSFLSFIRRVNRWMDDQLYGVASGPKDGDNYDMGILGEEGMRRAPRRASGGYEFDGGRYGRHYGDWSDRGRYVRHYRRTYYRPRGGYGSYRRRQYGW